MNFPQVLEMMAQRVDDYAAIGEAFNQDQGVVADSIQRLRAQPYAAGSLRSNTQQRIEVQQAPGQTIYVIQPANPQVVYVPQYDPTVVYVRPSGEMVAAPLINVRWSENTLFVAELRNWRVQKLILEPGK